MKLLLKLFFRTPFYRWMVDYKRKWALDLRWYCKYGRHFDWNNPIDLNEKIIWLEGCTDTTIWSRLADKYAVRSYVEEKGLAAILPKLHGVWDSVDDIDFSQLPDSFVIKCNHDCHSAHIVRDKSNVNLSVLSADLEKHIKRIFGYVNCEPHYTRIKPLILAEELLENTLCSISSSIVDYKVWCFQGKPCYVMTLHNRKKHSIDMNLYDLNWELHPEYMCFGGEFQDGKGEIPKPASFDEMMRAAAILSEGFPEVRVDFYDVSGKLYFGEMTFTSGNGKMPYYTPEFLKELGEKVILS